jgi:hypothetical protein
MKKGTLVSLLILILLLSACSSTATPTVVPTTIPTEMSTQIPTQAETTADANSIDNLPGNQDDQRQEPELSQAYQYALGILKLEETDQAITADQASALLPLWESLQTINQPQTSDPQNMPTQAANATPQNPQQPEDNSDEINTLTEQIAAALTADQLQAIDDLQISTETVDTLLTSLNIEISTPQGQPQGDGQAAGTPGQGGGPGGNGNGPANGGPGSSDATPPAQGGQPNGQGGGMRASQIPTAVLQAVIDLLNSKIG